MRDINKSIIYCKISCYFINFNVYLLFFTSIGDNYSDLEIYK